MFTLDILDGVDPLIKATKKTTNYLERIKTSYLDNWFLLIKTGRSDPQFPRGYGVIGFKISYQTNAWGNVSLDWLERTTNPFDTIPLSGNSIMFLYEQPFNNFILGSGIGYLSKTISTPKRDEEVISFGLKFSIGYQFKIGKHFIILPEYFANSSFKEEIGFSGFMLNFGWD